MDWHLFNIIGTIAFVISGAVAASEEEYDLIGFYAMGFVAAFGGGLLRNLIIGVPASTFWNQQPLFLLSFIIITVIYFVPIDKLIQSKHWVFFYGLIDAIGLAAFAIQGGMIAKNTGLPTSAVIVSSLLTGVGGGIIRDLLAKRQPFVFKYELYALWAILTGIIISISGALPPFPSTLLFIGIVLLRMVSMMLNWKIPRPVIRMRKRNSLLSKGSVKQ
ncbi:trimeric intracellular cation channel family protein [Robertmurraya korlensis]|uniref:trimeric intracellular cation channel family protein n=1 Tax=Robertmurraya korlensis TaxID=519977 RepID=UPI000825A299|nr:trimeric intracellular cation channel family protein [Robertmurraya korlensis]